MLKLRRNINQTLQGAPPSCESPRILPLAPCVPPEDVPPTRIHRTARDGAHSVKPMAHPGAPLRGGCASPMCIGCNHVAEAPRPLSDVREKKRVNPFFSHVNVNTSAGGTAAQRGDGRTFQTLSRHVYGFFRRRYAHNICTTCNVSTYCTQLKDLSGVVAEISDCRDHRHLLSRPSVPCPSLVCLIARYRSIISVL